MARSCGIAFPFWKQARIWLLLNGVYVPEGGWCHPLVVKASHCRPSASRRAGKPFFHSSASRLRGSGLPSSRNCDNFESSPGRRGLPTRMWCSSHLLFPVTSWQLQGGALPPLSCPVFAQAEPQAWLLHPPSLLMCSDPAFCTRQDCLRTATSIPRMLPRVLVDPLHGIRVGEAANPGPSTQPLITDFFRPNPESTFARAPSNCTDTSPEAEGVDLKLAVINPTALLGKESDIIGMQRNVYLISETSAVAQAQSIAASRFRQAQYKVQWSPPVPSHRCEGNATSLRGHAEGAAIVSNFPMRASFAGPPAAWKGSCRLVEGMLRIGWFSFRVISVYGFPANRAEAGLRNDELLRLALQTATSDHIPTLIGGDLNVEIQKLPVWEEYCRHGYQELFALWQSRMGLDLPPTCKGSTRHDTLLLPPSFQALLRTAQVDDTSHTFDAHAPLLVDFMVPTCPLVQHRWRMPRTWVSFPYDKQTFGRAYDACQHHVHLALANCVDKDSVDTALATWAQTVEAAVDASLQTANRQDPEAHPTSSLPKSCRGRLTFRPRLKFPLPATVRSAREGDYNPPAEVITNKGKAKVRQARRLQTYLAGLRKAHRAGTWEPPVCKQLEQEWAAICRARGYEPSFEIWLLNIAHFECFWWSWPPLDWLSDVCAYVRYDADVLVKSENRRVAQLSAYQSQLDIRTGYLRGHFASLRDPTRPPISAVPVTEEQTATKVRDIGHREALYDLRWAQAYKAAAPATVDGSPVEVRGLHLQEDESQLLRLVFPDGAPPTTCCLCQKSEASTGPELHRAFVEFWSPIWLRDRGAARTCPQTWEVFLQRLPPVPAVAQELLSVDLFTDKAWLQQVRLLKRRKATGYDGISNDELRSLPAAALLDLRDILLKTGECGWPTHAGSATVSCLAKVDCPQGMQHARPITILANTYRLWASTAARGILKHWGTWFPAEIFGCLPGRSSRDLSVHLELRVEQALLEGRDLAGFSIDLVKAFNNIPRLPMKRLLLHLSLPPLVIDIWFGFLAIVSRCPTFHNDLGCGVLSTTGLPEGDPLSVVGMLAICYAAHYWHGHAPGQLMSFVDNFSWIVEKSSDFAQALAGAQTFCDSLSMPIDWSKSYCWAVKSSTRKRLQQQTPRLLPEGCQLKLVQSAKDLGVVFRLGPQACLQASTKRLNQGLQRLKRLAMMCRPLLVKAHLLLSSVWPATFYGMEGQCLATNRLDALRTAATRAMIGHQHSASPWLTLACLTPRVLDPEPYGISLALCSLARLLKVEPELGQWWLGRAVLPFGKKDKVKGPASALSKALDRNGLVLQTDGTIKGPGHWQCNLHTSPPSGIRGAIEGAWRYELPTKLRHRNGLHQMMPPAADVTAKALSRFPPGEQMHLARTVAGGYMSAAARSTWDPLQEAACEFCGAKDTKYHRLLECPSLAQVRQPFQPLLDWIELEMPSWIHSPFACEHDSEAFLRLFWRSRHLREPPSIDSLIDRFGLRKLNFFTDGSCANSSCPAARHAAWAVVLDVQPEEALGSSQSFPSSQEMQARFHTVARGVLPGVQTICRAEFGALMQVCQLASRHASLPVAVWTDSQTALGHACDYLSGRPAVNSSNVKDLCSELPFELPPQNLELHKVKAHVQAESVPEAQWYQTLGNVAADAAARAALDDDLPLAAECCEAVRKWRHEQQERLYLFFTYLVALMKEVVPLRARARKTGSGQQPDLDDEQKRRLWCSLRPSNPQSQEPRAFPTAELQGASWPTWFLQAVWTWCFHLQWGSQDGLNLRMRGITFQELLANFVVFSGRCPPVQTEGQWYDPLDSSGILCPVYLREAINCLVQAVRFLERRSRCKLWQAKSHHRIWTLEFLGDQTGRKGLDSRPLWQCEEETFRLTCELWFSGPEILRESAWTQKQPAR